MIPMLGMAGATLFMGGCEKNETPKRDVEISFSPTFMDNFYQEDENGNRLPSPLALFYLNDPAIGDIYFVPSEDKWRYTSEEITEFRKRDLEPVMNYSPRFKGKGDFYFWLGEASKVPEDSLWIVSKGWTINKQYQNTKQR